MYRMLYIPSSLIPHNTQNQTFPHQNIANQVGNLGGRGVPESVFYLYYIKLSFYDLVCIYIKMYTIDLDI